MQYGIAGQNAKLDGLWTAIGASPKLIVYSGAIPADCAAVPGGVMLADIALPATPMAAAANGAKVKVGTWSGVCSVAGTASFFRIYNAGETVCHIQGTVGLSGEDMNLSDITLEVGQAVTVNTFTLTEGMS
jgi:hypothetical protein